MIEVGDPVWIGRLEAFHRPVELPGFWPRRQAVGLESLVRAANLDYGRGRLKHHVPLYPPVCAEPDISQPAVPSWLALCLIAPTLS